MTISRARLRATATLATTIMLALAAAACGGDEDVDLPDPAPPQTPVAEPTAPELDLTAEEQEAFDEIQAMFEEFVTIYQEILVSGEPALEAGLDRLPYGNQIFETWDEVEDNFANERRGDGTLEWSLVEAEVDLDNVMPLFDDDQEVPLVRLRYCVDATNWQIVDKDTGDPAEASTHRVMAEPGARHLVTVQALYYDSHPDGENPYWQLTSWENEEDQPC